MSDNEPQSNIVSLYWYRLTKKQPPTLDEKIKSALDKQKPAPTPSRRDPP